MTAVTKYTKQPVTANLSRYTDYELRKIEQVISALNARLSELDTLLEAIVALNWLVPTLVNSWVNFGGGQQDAEYTKDVFGWVHIRGCVKSGTTGNTIFTLPVGYRPSPSGLIFPASTGLAGGQAYGRVDVVTDGRVIHIAGGNEHCALNFSFYAGA